MSLNTDDDDENDDEHEHDRETTPGINETMLLKLIACNVFQREACHCLARTPHTLDVEFTELGEHAHSATLRERLQGRIDAAETCGKRYDAVLLLFGLCGNATVGLAARATPLVLPRAHDCCTILLGSRAKYNEHFAANPSTPFSSNGYLERGDYFLRVGEQGVGEVRSGDAFAAMVEQYGAENARMIWETMHPESRKDRPHRAVYIDIPETAQAARAESFRAKAEAEGWAYERLEGSLRLIRKLIDAEWDAADFLVVEPGQRIAGVYDFEEIVRAEGTKDPESLSLKTEA
jgi:hypothetical protein